MQLSPVQIRARPIEPFGNEFYELRRLGAEPLSPRTGESLTKGCEGLQYQTEDRDICLYRYPSLSLRPPPAFWDILGPNKKPQNVLELEARGETYAAYLGATDEVLEQEVCGWLRENADTLVRGEDIPEEPDYSPLNDNTY